MHTRLVDNGTLLKVIKRMDDMEKRLLERIDILDSFRLRVIGGAMVLSFVVTTAFQIWRK